MKKFFLVFSIIFIGKFSAQSWKTEDQYIQKFAEIAVEEMEKYKIPASITLAQGLLETGGGQSRLAVEGNNHFGIKCKEDWTGKTMKHTDDAPDECFRVYDDVRQSYEDHSIFLATRKYYTGLFKLDPKDYKAWAHGLKKAGYATNPKYAYILISKIEKYKLYEFDYISKKDVFEKLLALYPNLREDAVFMAKNDQAKVKTPPATVTVPYQQTSYAKQQETVNQLKSNSEILKSILVKNHPNDGLKFFIVPGDIELDLISRKFGISNAQLMKYNELSSTQLKKNQIVFLENKKSNGNTPTYEVQVGETMYDVAQKLGIKLKSLYSKNRMTFGEQPKPGDILYLKSKRPRI